MTGSESRRLFCAILLGHANERTYSEYDGLCFRWLSRYATSWLGSWDYCAFAKHCWKYWGGAANPHWREHHHLHDLCERARQDAYESLCQHAIALGANAVIGLRYDATEIAQGVAEVLCYGTAVVVEKVAA